MKNSEVEFRQILKLFCLEMDASKVAGFVGRNRVTINQIFDKIRIRITAICEAESSAGSTITGALPESIRG